MFFPKRFKHQILQKKRTPKTPIYSNTLFIYGTSACKPITIGVLTAKHMRRLILILKRIFKKSKKKYLWIPYFPHTPIFKKKTNARMGKGKGKRVGWYTPIYPGFSFFEVKNMRFGRMKKFGKTVISRLPVKAKYISKALFFRDYLKPWKRK